MKEEYDIDFVPDTKGVIRPSSQGANPISTPFLYNQKGEGSQTVSRLLVRLLKRGLQDSLRQHSNDYLIHE
jgi:hypothetical protein